MQKNIETLLDALRGIEEPKHFLRFVASRIDWDADRVFDAYEATLGDRNAAKEAQIKLASDALAGLSKGDVIALLGGVGITGLIDERAKAKSEKNYLKADAIRDGLSDVGIALKDTPKGTEWETK